MAVTPEPAVATPEERTQGREKILAEQRGLAGPDLEEQKRIQRRDMIRQVAQNTMKNINSPIALAGVAGQARATGAQIPVAEQAQAGELALQTEAMAGDASLAKQEQRAKQSQFAASEAIERLALETARRAFDLGFNSKQLALHSNSKVADLAMQQMYKDFREGRITERELADYTRGLAKETNRMKIDAEVGLREAMQEFNAFMEKGNAERAKERILEALNRYKEALKMAARASNGAAMLGGIFSIAGAAVGSYVGGPGGAVVGSKFGGSIGRSLA